MKIVIAALVVFISFPACTTERAIPFREKVKFQNDGASLEGELSIPAGSGPHPLAIFIHGSGKVTRHDYEEFVLPMTKEGIATFRYDKRGVGASGGEYYDVAPYNAEHVFSLLASDAAAAIRHLGNDNRIAKDKIIVIGGSQAGWIIPGINIISDVWLSICISGPSVTVGEEIFYSDLVENGSYSQAEADNMLADFNGLHGYDPIGTIEKMTSPSLWIFGGKDVSIPVKKVCIFLIPLRNREFFLSK